MLVRQNSVDAFLSTYHICCKYTNYSATRKNKCLFFCILAVISPILLVINQKSCNFAAKETKKNYENRNYCCHGQGAATASGSV